MFEIIDPHIHYWNPYTTPRTVSPVVRFFGRFPKLVDRIIRLATPAATVNYFGATDLFSSPYLPETYFGTAGDLPIKGVVHVQADWQAKRPLNYADETKWLDGLDRPPLAIVGEARLNDVKNLGAVLDAHAAASPRFRGIRDMLAYHPAKTIHKFNTREDMASTPEFRRGFAMLGERDLTFDAFIYSHQLEGLCELVESVGNTAVVLDHVGTPIGMMGPFGGIGETAAEREKIKAAWQNGLKRLAQSEQVMVKLSGLFMHVLGWPHHEWHAPLTVEQVVEMIVEPMQFVIETFGVERCMFASNFPPDSVLMQHQTLYEAYFKLVEHLDEADQRALFAENAKRFYTINV